ncbi:sulfatase-like hydrolase/transferase [Saccharicrinis sp. GN24d3]|uniref:sulfatase-like hydrolase/transferase n=1 Tax=Saccharicrinis sp. GN24d3 TaxID=3458416 RepID=UPI004036DBAD
MLSKINKSLQGILLILLIASLASCSQEPENKLPNIVYIICDDLGYGDVQCLNPEKGKIKTPQIDALSAESMTFTDAHSGSSVCTPTRYGVLTGRYAWRSRLQDGVLGGGQEFEPLIADDQLTVPALLKKAGYQTAAMGKWHLGFAVNDAEGNPVDVYQGKRRPGPAPVGSIVPNGPITRGFDTYLGFHHSASMETVIKDGKVIKNMPTIKMLQFLGKNASQYIAEKAKEDNPFFLYLALNSPHTPIVPSEAWQGKSGMSPYCDFVMETDDVVGQVIDALKENGVDENTLVFFTSDNGCSYPAARGGKLEKEFGHYPSAQYRGSKSDIWEGGHRVPFIAKWTGKIEAGSKNDHLICLTSLLGTCAEITGIQIPEDAGEDSYSILSMLKDKEVASPYEAVIHHSIQGKFSIRRGKWKLELCPGSGGWSGPNDKQARKQGLPEIQLYNLENDEAEQNNVFQDYPEVVEELKAELVSLVENGRTTKGAVKQNDVEVDIYKSDK